MRIIRARLKPYGGNTEYITGTNRIKSLVINNVDDEFQFVLDNNGNKYVKEFSRNNINSELIEKSPIQILDSEYLLKFNEEGTIEVIEIRNESLPRQSSVDQLKKLRSLTKGIDIGDRISDMGDEGANIKWIRNPIDSGIESYEEFTKRNKEFIPGWNTKGLKSPFNERKKRR